MEAPLEEVGLLEGSSPTRDEMNVLVKFEGGGLDSPKISRSPRKKSLRPVAFRGRLAKSGPKSPLMRMAEMRKDGLRGRALRHSGRKGLDGEYSSPKKSFGGRGVSVLATISECAREEELNGEGGVVVGTDGVDGVQTREVVVMMEDHGSGNSGGFNSLDSPSRRSEEGCSKHLWQKEPIQEGSYLDLALDIMSSQPLQEMGFIGEQVSPIVAGSGEQKDCLMLELNQTKDNGNKMISAAATDSRLDEDFPLLSKESLKASKGKGEVQGARGTRGIKGA